VLEEHCSGAEIACWSVLLSFKSVIRLKDDLPLTRCDQPINHAPSGRPCCVRPCDRREPEPCDEVHAAVPLAASSLCRTGAAGGSRDGGAAAACKAVKRGLLVLQPALPGTSSATGRFISPTSSHLPFAFFYWLAPVPSVPCPSQPAGARRL
jgi:hypothetical protein